MTSKIRFGSWLREWNPACTRNFAFSKHLLVPLFSRQRWGSGLCLSCLFLSCISLLFCCSSKLSACSALVARGLFVVHVCLFPLKHPLAPFSSRQRWGSEKNEQDDFGIMTRMIHHGEGRHIPQDSFDLKNAHPAGGQWNGHDHGINSVYKQARNNISSNISSIPFIRRQMTTFISYTITCPKDLIHKITSFINLSAVVHKRFKSSLSGPNPS